MLDLTNLMEALVSLAAVVITTFVVPFIKSKTTAQQQQDLAEYVRIGVTAAEQIFNGPGRGKEKKQYVLQYLEGRGYHIDEDALDTLLESIVNGLKGQQAITLPASALCELPEATNDTETESTCKTEEEG